MTSPWTPLNSSPGQRVFFRPLGITESNFYWDGVFNSTADIVVHAHLRSTQANDPDIHSQPNVMRSWASVKKRFPLVAAEVQEYESGLRFILREEAVTHLRPADVTFKEINSLHHAESFINNIMDGPRPLSSQLLARIYVLRRTDRNDHFHIVIIIAHCVTDMPSTSTVLRTFLDTLSSRMEPPYISLDERVHMYQPLESRLSYGNLPLVKRRWRRALGYAIFTVWMTKFKGGHTLPGNFSHSTFNTPAKARSHISIFSSKVSSVILSNCRRHSITMNSACFALSQVALARVLCRRYIRGQISEEEWDYRKRQPMHFTGGLNLRPYQDLDWFQTGGSGDVGINISFFWYTLPFMPLGEMSKGDASKLELVDGAPDFQALMSFDRFLLRCAYVKAQAQEMFKHPRFIDICTAGHDRVASTKEIALNWLEMKDSVLPEDGHGGKRSVQSLDPIAMQRGSALGNMETVLPLDYPLSPDHELSPLRSAPHPHRAGYPAWSPPVDDVEDAKTPRLHIEYWRSHVHAHPGELYFGSSFANQQLQYFTSYDQRVFSEETVQEWMRELKDAAMWYLGQSHDDKVSLQSKL